MSAPLLVVDDDADFRELVAEILRGDGHQVVEAGDAEQALALAARQDFAVALIDQRLPGLDGHELARRLRAAARPPAVVLMTAFGTIPDAVEAVRLGAADYLTKPLESPQTLRQLVSALLGRRPSTESGAEEFLTRDPALLGILGLADRAAATDATVLVMGESGTGKELIAARVHRNSRRAGGPFVAINCAALSESLAESELFGHEKGAFTGALARHKGRFELAHRGTLLLDEVGELSDALQSKLLRVLEQRTVERVGGGEPIAVDVRLVAATNRDLAAEVTAGRFRSDLYYRLAVMTLVLPPLRDRIDDLDVLAPALIDRLAARLGVPPRPLSAAARDALRAHAWPGNVRELRNVLERALVVAGGEEIGAADLPPLGRGGGDGATPAEAALSLVERERAAILLALERASGNRERAARLLGISVRTLYSRLRDYGLR